MDYVLLERSLRKLNTFVQWVGVRDIIPPRQVKMRPSHRVACVRSDKGDPESRPSSHRRYRILKICRLKGQSSEAIDAMQPQSIDLSKLNSHTVAHQDTYLPKVLAR